MAEASGEKTLLDKILQFSEKYFVVIAIMLYLLRLHNICLGAATDSINEYELSTYLLNYSDGFGTRMLIGSIIQVVFGGMISREEIFLVNHAILFLNCMIISIFFGRLVEKQKNSRHKIAILLLIILFFALPSTSIWSGKYIGRLDIYLVLCAMISIWIISRQMAPTLKYFIISLLSIIAILIHQAYVFTYFVPVFIALVWDIIKSDYKGKQIVKSIVIILIPMLGVFIFLQCFSPVHYDTLEEVHNICAERTTDHFDDDMLRLEYVLSNQENLLDIGWSVFIYSLDVLSLAFLSIIPFGVFVFVFWKRIFMQTHDKKRKIAFALMHLSFLVYVPLFILTYDYGRWLTSLLISVMVNIFLGIYYKDEAFLKVLDEGYTIGRKYYYLVAIFIAYYASMGLYEIGF